MLSVILRTSVYNSRAQKKSNTPQSCYTVRYKTALNPWEWEKTGARLSFPLLFEIEVESYCFRKDLPKKSELS